MVGSSKWQDTHTDPLWPGGVSEAPAEQEATSEGPGWDSFESSWRSLRGAWILTDVKTPSDTLSHTHWLIHTHSQTLPPHAYESLGITPLTASNASGPTLFSFFFFPPSTYVHKCKHKNAYTPKRIIHFKHRKISDKAEQSGNSVKRGSEDF